MILIEVSHLNHGENRFLHVCFLLVAIIYCAIGSSGINPNKSMEETKVDNRDKLTK